MSLAAEILKATRKNATIVIQNSEAYDGITIVVISQLANGQRFSCYQELKAIEIRDHVPGLIENTLLKVLEEFNFSAIENKLNEPTA